MEISWLTRFITAASQILVFHYQCSARAMGDLSTLWRRPSSGLGIFTGHLMAKLSTMFPRKTSGPTCGRNPLRAESGDGSRTLDQEKLATSVGRGTARDCWWCGG